MTRVYRKLSTQLGPAFKDNSLLDGKPTRLPLCLKRLCPWYCFHYVPHLFTQYSFIESGWSRAGPLKDGDALNLGISIVTVVNEKNK